MKTFFTILLATAFFSFKSYAQDNMTTPIEKLRVVYKTVPAASGNLTSNGVPDIQVQANMIMTLKPDTTASVIYVKVTSQQSNTLVYQVNYPLSAAPITGDGGIVLYKKENNTIEICNPSAVSLKPYLYEIYTVDTEGKKSNTYSITQ